MTLLIARATSPALSLPVNDASACDVATYIYLNAGTNQLFKKPIPFFHSKLGAVTYLVLSFVQKTFVPLIFYLKQRLISYNIVYLNAFIKPFITK